MSFGTQEFFNVNVNGVSKCFHEIVCPVKNIEQDRGAEKLGQTKVTINIVLALAFGNLFLSQSALISTKNNSFLKPLLLLSFLLLLLLSTYSRKKKLENEILRSKYVETTSPFLFSHQKSEGSR